MRSGLDRFGEKTFSQLSSLLIIDILESLVKHRGFSPGRTIGSTEIPLKDTPFLGKIHPVLWCILMVSIDDKYLGTDRRRASRIQVRAGVSLTSK